MVVITFDKFCDKHAIYHFREAFFHYFMAKGVGGALSEEKEFERCWGTFCECGKVKTPSFIDTPYKEEMRVMTIHSGKTLEPTFKQYPTEKEEGKRER